MTFKCLDCEYSSSNKRDIAAHQETNHGINEHPKNKYFLCDLCEYSSTSNSHFRLHLSSRHFICLRCNFKASSKIEHIAHLSKHPEYKFRKCPYCNYQTYLKRCLTDHIRVHTGDRPFKCKKCLYRARYKFSLDVHVEVVHENKRTIPSCLKRNKFYECPPCEYKTISKAIFKRHLASHSKVKEQKSLLKECHVVLTRDEFYACTLCKYVTFSKAIFVEHMETHSAELREHFNISKANIKLFIE